MNNSLFKDSKQKMVIANRFLEKINNHEPNDDLCEISNSAWTSFSTGTEGIEALVHDTYPQILNNYTLKHIRHLLLGPYPLTLSDKYIKSFIENVKIYTMVI